MDAVLADIAGRGITHIVNLGDCAYGPFDPRPVMNRLLELDMPTVSGNEDRILVETARGMSHSRTAALSAKLLDRLHIEWLAALPPTLNVHGAFLFHGIPEDDTQYLLIAVEESGVRPRDTNEIEHLLLRQSHPLILCGHDHTPRAVTLESGCHVINPGSVGCQAYTDDVPHEHAIENGSPHARYAVAEIQDNIVSAEFVSVPYDWETAAKEAEVNGFPDWARWIQTGRVN